MKEVSDRIVLFFLALAIMTTIGGFLAILTSISGNFPIITGFATDSETATVNVSVAATAAITLFNATNVSFGSGTLVGGETGTRINTSGTTPNVGGFDKPGPITVRNDGNVDLNITINGTLPSVWLNSGSTYEYAGATGEGGCPATNLTTTRRPFSATLTRACANLTFSDGADDFDIDIYLNLSSSLAATNYVDSAILIRADSCTGPC